MSDFQTSSNPLIRHTIVLEHYQRNPNYHIEHTTTGENLCVIYFSSHGIYFPNDPATFTESVIHNDRYDWKRNKIVRARKHIFVRDIFKQWYVEGINAELNSVERVAEWLKQETVGMDVLTIGSSAGAYAAVLFGCLLQAQYVYAFSPQFDLTVHDTSNDLLIQSHLHTPAAQYYQLPKLIDQSVVPIFYFYGANSSQDQTQAALIRQLSSVWAFPVASAAHGIPIYPFDFDKLLNLTAGELIALQQSFNGRVVSPRQFSVALNGWGRFMRLYARFALKALRKRLKSSR